MMRLTGCILLGGLLGLFNNWWKRCLEKDFDEIKVEDTNNKWLLPCLTAIISGWLSSVTKNNYILIFNIVIVSLLILLACFDYQYMLLPTKVIVPGIIIACISRGVMYLITKEKYYLIEGLLGGIIGFGLFFLIFYGSIWILKKEGLGFGDVRLMAFIGIVIGIGELFIFIIISSLLAVLVGGMLLVIKQKSEAFPFGPFLCSGAIIMLLLGEEIMTIYLRCLNLG